MQIYCDNGSTSFPKAPGLGKIMGEHIDNNGYNISRGGYGKAYSVEEKVIETKELLCNMFSCDNPRNVVFTPGATYGLNMIISGLLTEGDHVITTSIEHNAVVRPLAFLSGYREPDFKQVDLNTELNVTKRTGKIQWSEALCDESGRLDTSDIERLIKPNTKLVLITHASNVCGTMTDICEVGRICREKGVYFAVDAAQSAGSEHINMEACNIDALAFPGHKGLLGPQGIGGLILNDKIAAEISPIILGGTGSFSDKEEMPPFMPDKFQPGTLNLPGIIGLNHALKYIEKEGIDAIKEKKMRLTRQFIEATMNMQGVRIAGISGTEGRCGVVSLDFKANDNAEVSFLLEKEYGIMTRCGMHCAPHAHKTLNTFPQGTVRFAFGYFNTKEEVSMVIDGINNIIKD